MNKRITWIFLTTLTIAVASQSVGAAEADWRTKAISPVVNPIFFESPLIESEVRPLFAYHRLDRGLLGVDADVRVYAVQLRYALTPRLAIIATKDGYMEIAPQAAGAKTLRGWNDIAAGLKYSIYQNEEQQVQITPGLTFELPSGNTEVFQGNGDGEFNVFVSAIKGFNNLHFTGNLGFRIPIDGDEETANVRYAIMVDYYTCQWFIPFATINAMTTLTEGTAVPFKSEGFDVINFGASNARGETQAAWGVGFRSRLHKRLDLGFAFEQGFTPSDDIFNDRFTVDLIWRF